MRARRGAVDHALEDPLQDRGDAEQVVSEVEVPVTGVYRISSSPFTVAAHILLFAGNAQILEIEAGDAAELARRDVPAHAVVGEVDQRIAERRQLPVEHREDARLGGVED